MANKLSILPGTTIRNDPVVENGEGQVRFQIYVGFDKSEIIKK